ncbi:hypothetical protein FRC00_004486, partial [Tulasnella sp. 408]
TSDPGFGMILPPRTNALPGAEEYGTMLEIKSVQMLPDGRSMVETKGTYRFRIAEKGTLDGYMVARIVRIDDLPDDADDLLEQTLTVPQQGLAPEPTVEQLMETCREFYDQLKDGTAPWVVQQLNSTYGPMPEDPSTFGFWMAVPVLTVADTTTPGSNPPEEQSSAVPANPGGANHSAPGQVPEATAKHPSKSRVLNLQAVAQHDLPLRGADHLATTGRTNFSRSSAPEPPEPTEKNVPQDLSATLPSCPIERLGPELLETIFLCLVELNVTGHREQAQNQMLVKTLVLVCRRWSAVAARLALVTIEIEGQRSVDRVIEHAKKLSNTQGGRAPTRVLEISDQGEGTFHRLPELIELFGKTLYKLKLNGKQTRWDSPKVEGRFPPAIEGKVYLPVLRTLEVWYVTPATAQECLRHIDPTTIREMILGVARVGSPVEGYLNGQVFPRLQELLLGKLLFGEEAPWEDLKTAAPALKSLHIAASDSTISELVAHLRTKWPGMLKCLEVGVWDMSESMMRDDPAVCELIELATEKKLEDFELEVESEFGPRTLYKLELNGTRRQWHQPYAEGSFPPTIEGQVHFPMLQTLIIWEVAPATVQECLRNVDPTKVKDMGLSVPRAGSPEEGYLNGQVFPRLKTLKLGMLLFGGESPYEDLKTATPALQSLRIAASYVNIADLVARMRRNWPGKLKCLDVGVWDMFETLTRGDLAVREFAELAKGKKLDHFVLGGAGVDETEAEGKFG